LLSPEPRSLESSATKSILHVGIDDTDSPRKGCTTYVAALLLDELTKLGCNLVDYPNLVRLNPNVPWKTRGNGAVCLRFVCSENEITQVMKLVVNVVKKNSDLADRRADPAVAFLKGVVTSDLASFSKRVIRSVVTVNEAERVAARSKIHCIRLKGKKGTIGAIAAIGEDLRSDHTYELIAYRIQKNRSLPRNVDPDSVFRMNRETTPLTFNNIDPETNRILITPRGRDPILYGIRGETPKAVLRAHQMVKANEEIERWVIFRTNHGTDDHYSKLSKISDVRAYRPAVIIGKVVGRPFTIPGGHVIFRLSDDSGVIDCAAYEPTGGFRKTIRKLVEGDLIEAYGGVRKGSPKHKQTLNLEKIKIIDPATDCRYENPRCPRCGKRMESAGRGQGFRCRKCDVIDPAARKVPVVIERSLPLGIHIPPPRAHRHLTKPISRYGREKNRSEVHLAEPWHWP
jgi:tRNA(Ile2)-agmatinylcytidine synthase